MNVIESAQRVDAASGDILCGGQAYLGYVKDSQELARFVLSLSERLTPDVVESAERLTENQYVKGQAGNIDLAMALMQTDHRTLAMSVALPTIAQLREGT